MAETCQVYRIGRMPYEQAWGLQKRLAGEIADGRRPPTLLLLEHPHTYTFGRMGRVENLLWDAAELERRAVQVLWVDRGGDVTYHGPGQLVGYPLLPLAPGGLKATPAAPGGMHLPTQVDYVGYIRKLEETLILALMRLGVISGQISGRSGVWVQPDALSRCLACRPELRRAPAKIAAIGVKVDVRGVSQHGFALNVAPEMEYWDGIIGCGLKNSPTASLADFFAAPPSMKCVMEAVETAFGEVFGFQMVDGGTIPSV